MSQPRLLILKNEEIALDRIIGSHNKNDYSISVASTPKDALKLLHKKHIDVAVVDASSATDLLSGDATALKIIPSLVENKIPTVVIVSADHQTQESLVRHWNSYHNLVAFLDRRGPNLDEQIREIVANGIDQKGMLGYPSAGVTGNPTTDPPPPDDYRYLRIDLDKRLVRKRGRLLALTTHQYLLLEALYKKAGGICSHGELILAVYGKEMEESAARKDPRLRSLVYRTKAKLEDTDMTHEHLQMISGRGYRLEL